MASTQSLHKEEKYYALRSRLSVIPKDLTHLPPDVEEYLTLLADIADELLVDDVKISSISSAISYLSSDELELRRSILAIRQSEGNLSDYLSAIQHEHNLINKWLAELNQDNGQMSVHASELRTAALVAQAKEYERELEKLKATMPPTPPITISQLAEEYKQLRSTEQELKEKRAKVQVYQGLPPNLELARLELQAARDDQMKLIQLRERLLSNMVDGVR